LDGFSRVRELVGHVLDGLPPSDLHHRLDPDANTIGWLVWHLTRVQDDHIAGVADLEQVWTEQSWDERFALPFDAGAIGYGQNSDDVAAVTTPADLLGAYHEATYAQTCAFVASVSDPDLERIVDAAWDPPVTLGVRLMSVLSDDLQHVGQAAFIRGVLSRRST
jgi:uncharacterized damage-inducible protein DinB